MELIERERKKREQVRGCAAKPPAIVSSFHFTPDLFYLQMLLLKAEQMKRYEKEKVGNDFLLANVVCVHPSGGGENVLQISNDFESEQHSGSGLMFELIVISDEPWLKLIMMNMWSVTAQSHQSSERTGLEARFKFEWRQQPGEEGMTCFSVLLT